MKTLILVRHAKSSWDDPSLDDFDRPLNKRGKRDAPRMGNWLAGQGIFPSLIMSSPARRARTTAKKLGTALDYPLDNILYESCLYEAGTRGIFHVIEQCDEHHEQVMLVGHNPAITDVVNRVSGEDIANVPTCGVAVIGFAMNSWSTVSSTTGQLLALYIPKQLPPAA